MPHRAWYKITWHKVYKNLGGELTAQLVGLSKKDLKAYLDERIKVPAIITDRLDFLVELYRCLRRTYSKETVKIWLRRKRVSLDKQSPQDILFNGWRPLGKLPQKVLKLAIELEPKRKRKD